MNSWMQHYLLHVCMPTFHTFTWEFSLWEYSVCSSVHWNSQKGIYYCLVITLWKFEYCLIWALNKSILFVSISLKLSVLCDMNSEKGFYYSLIYSVLLDIYSGKTCSIVCKKPSEDVTIAWYRERCVVLFGSNSLKLPVMFDMNSENVFILVW